MKDRSVDWKKILTWKPGEKLLAIGFCLLLLAALIPLFRLTIYAVPYYDDYNFGRFARAAMEQEQSKWAAIPGALECSRTQWYAWQGTYSSIFFMTLMPAIWGEQYYFLGPVFILLLLLAGSMVFTHVILRKVFGMEKWISLAIQAVITTAQFMFIYSAQSGFYWYNGGIHYVGMHGFGLLFLAVSICLERAEGRTAKGLLFTASVLLAMITAGSNFVTALQGLLCLATILLVSVVLERRKCGLWLLPATAVYIIGFGLNVAAPGNSVRAQSYIGWGYGPTIRVHRQILFGSRETHSGVYRFGSTDGDVIVGAPDLAGSEKHGLPVPLSRDRTCLVLWPVCHRLYAKPVFPGTCRLVQNSECGKNYVFYVVIFKRDLLVRLA